MSFCLNCGNHKTCDCAGPPMGVDTHRDDTFGCPPPEISFGPTVESLEAREHLPKHPATKWFDQQVEDGLIPGEYTFLAPSQLRVFLEKAFNAGASYACREIRDVIPRGPLADCCRDEFQFAVEDIDAICTEWLG